MIRALIVDDEPLARERIRTLIEAADGIEPIGECRNGLEAVEAIDEQAPDVVFLDIQMPELDGFGVIDAVGMDRMPAVVFVTAYDEFALRAFDAHAVDYLLKPYDRERFDKALERLRRRLARGADDAIDRRLLSLMEDLRPRRHVERVVIRVGGKLVFLRVEEIDWIEAEGNYARLHVGQESHLIRDTMSALEEKLDPDRFVRIHRSRIVNVERIKELEPLFQGDYVIVLEDGTRINSSRGYRDRLQDLLSDAL